MLLQQILFTFLNYYILLFAYYWYHRLLHNPKSGILYQLHYIGHHKTDFPLRKLRASSYNIDGTGGWFKTGGELVFGLPVIAILASVYYTTPAHYFINFIGCLLYIIASGEICHSSYHLTQNATSHPESLHLHKWLIHRNWFPFYQKLHDIHHANTNVNYGFVDMTMDKLFGTYSDIMPLYMKYFPIPNN